MNKKKRLIVKIVAGLLCLIMVAGMIVPYVSATSIDSENVKDIITDMFQKEDVEHEELAESSVPKPTNTLPIGFDYVLEGDNWVIRKTDGNKETAFILEGYSSGFDQPIVTFFIGNLKTHKVESVELLADESYVSSINLSDGYYVVFSNEYAWSDKDGNIYAINNNEFKYIYVGEPTNTDINDITFAPEDGIFSIELGMADESMTVVPYGETLEVTSKMLEYPDDAVLKEVEENVDETNHIKKPSEEQEKPVDEEKVSLTKRLLGGLWRSLKGSIIPLILLGICGCSYLVIKKKKEKELLSQTENDKYDDSRIE